MDNLPDAEIVEQAERARPRFVEKYIPEPNSGCWLWIGAVNDDGYGSLWVDSRSEKAHRISWLLHFGTIPETMHVLHKCDTPPCVNPNHLFLGTHSENMIDMIKKLRHFSYKYPEKQVRGEKVGTSKLVASQVMEIRRDQRTIEKIAMTYGVCPSTISAIRRRERWGHLP